MYVGRLSDRAEPVPAAADALPQLLHFDARGYEGWHNDGMLGVHAEGSECFVGEVESTVTKPAAQFHNTEARRICLQDGAARGTDSPHKAWFVSRSLDKLA